MVREASGDPCGTLCIFEHGSKVSMRPLEGTEGTCQILVFNT
jgi:hypothetical protein